MDNQQQVRKLLLEQLNGRNAHIDFNRAVEGLEHTDAGVRPADFPHSIWELVEHIRIAQRDIVEFSINPDYTSPRWPEGYWPPSEAPAGPKQWSESLKAVQIDKQRMVDIIKDPSNDLLTPIEHGDGQTLFREAVLIVDHNAYHIGQIVQIRKYLDLW